MFCCPGCHFWLAPDPLFLAPLATLQKYPQTGPQVPAKVDFTDQKPGAPRSRAAQASQHSMAPKGAQNPGLGLRRKFKNRVAVPSHACLEYLKEENSSRLAVILLHFIFFLRKFRRAAVLDRCASLCVLVGYIVQLCQVLRFICQGTRSPWLVVAAVA